MRILQSINHVFNDPVCWFDHDRTQCRERSFCGAAIVHRNTEEPSVSEGLRFRTNFFKVTSKRFLTCVDAGHDLKLCLSWNRQRFGSANADCIQRLTQQMSLKRQLENTPPFQRVKGPDFFGKLPELRIRKLMQHLRRPAMSLGQLQKREGLKLRGAVNSRRLTGLLLHNLSETCSASRDGSR